MPRQHLTKSVSKSRGHKYSGQAVVKLNDCFGPSGSRWSSMGVSRPYTVEGLRKRRSLAKEMAKLACVPDDSVRGNAGLNTSRSSNTHTLKTIFTKL